MKTKICVTVIPRLFVPPSFVHLFTTQLLLLILFRHRGDCVSVSGQRCCEATAPEGSSAALEII